MKNLLLLGLLATMTLNAQQPEAPLSDPIQESAQAAAKEATESAINAALVAVDVALAAEREPSVLDGIEVGDIVRVDTLLGEWGQGGSQWGTWYLVVGFSEDRKLVKLARYTCRYRKP